VDAATLTATVDSRKTATATALQRMGAAAAQETIPTTNGETALLATGAEVAGPEAEPTFEERLLRPHGAGTTCCADRATMKGRDMPKFMTVHSLLEKLNELKDEEKSMPVVVYSCIDEGGDIPIEVRIETGEAHSYCRGDHPIRFLGDAAKNGCVVIR
jgi:hypothetical protein